MNGKLVRYKGEDITFRITLEDGAQSIERWTELQRVVVYAYTTKSNLVRFEKCFDGASNEGYQPLELINDEKTLTGRLTTDNTIAMAMGTLFLEVLADDGGDLTTIAVIRTDTKLADCIIKEEAK